MTVLSECFHKHFAEHPACGRVPSNEQTNKPLQVHGLKNSQAAVRLSFRPDINVSDFKMLCNVLTMRMGRFFALKGLLCSI